MSYYILNQCANYICCSHTLKYGSDSVADPDPNPDLSDPYVFGPPGSGLTLLDPDPLVRGMDPDPSIAKENSKKNLDSY